MRKHQGINDLYVKVGTKIAVILTTKFQLPSDIVEDAVHDLFVSMMSDHRIANRVTKLPEEEAFRYLLKAGHRLAIREIQRRRHVQQSLEEFIANLISYDFPDLELDRTEMIDAIRAELEQLKEPYREVLKLLLEERKSATEIGHLLNRPVNTIYQQVHRGFHKLRSAIRHFR